MRSTQQFSITLPLYMAEAVEGKIKSGGYAPVNEVMRDRVRALLERDTAVEKWLREKSSPVIANISPIPRRGFRRRRFSVASRPAARRAGSGDFVRVVFTPRAERHLDALHDFIARQR